MMTVNDLAHLTGTSTITVRRDLNELAEQGSVRRVRGGAAPALSRGDDFPFDLRRSEANNHKLALAQAAAKHVRPGDSVIIDNGTTALAVARQLAGLGITAMALSLRAAEELHRKPGNQVLVPGGPLSFDELSFVGAGTAEAVASMRFDVAIIGACAANIDTGLTVSQWDDAYVKRAVLKSAQRSILVATADKFNRTAAHKFGDVTDLDTIITTGDLSVTTIYEASQSGVEVITV
ncbi:DeoR/GlpR family DNA-binding transcription regulator [Glutamicibacter sp. JL.03c]|uniref:DeoR/GlpR family DNA-binding transcription regulator n=1 Tax=Glutamicibacter sp. JL.03c TaxID=2984842 RepID=UPI0021F703F2|nr:DeoR/GlpR family DNA-binding transcription regulator [Glutamicibacter sp. JL.03c]UYQ77476.1 DeoR/GlpR family DNA-binding transcription regulator [Glutamicibacter sp. JL.03c]